VTGDYQHKLSQAYSEKNFWNKVQKYALSAGVKVIYAVLLLYYALKEPKTPSWAKGVIFSALGYFISPLDAIPDIVPIAGYTDDLGVLALALVAVGMFIDNNVKSKAREKILEWFPNVAEDEFSEIDAKL